MGCPCPLTPARPLQVGWLDTTEVLNLATGVSSPGPTLPSASANGCAAWDPDSGYVYYVEGFGGVAGKGVFRIAGRSWAGHLRALRAWL